MNWNRIEHMLKKAVAAILAFLFGFAVSLFAWLLLAPKPASGDSFDKLLSELLFSLVPFAVSVLAGLVAAGLSLLLHPSVMFRGIWLVYGLLAIAIGVVCMVPDTFFWRYVAGPLLVLLGLYGIWTTFFGSREDVEELPPI